MESDINNLSFQWEMPNELCLSDRYSFYRAIHSQAKRNIASQLYLYNALLNKGYCQDKKLKSSLYEEFKLLSTCLQNTNCTLLKMEDDYKKIKNYPFRSIFILSIIALIAFVGNAIFISSFSGETLVTQSLITNFLLITSSAFFISIFLFVGHIDKTSRLTSYETQLNSLSCLYGIEESCYYINKQLIEELKQNVLDSPYSATDFIDFSNEDYNEE